MALWQIGFFILPQDCKSQISDLRISDEYSFDDAPFWNESKTSPDYFEGIDKFLQKNKSWADYITLYGHENSNRLEVISENNIVESVSFRIDFTSDYELVLKGIIEFCILNGLIILDQNLNIVPLNFETAKSIVNNALQVMKYNNLLNGKSPE